LPIQPVENCSEKSLSVPYRIVEGDPAAFDIRLIQVNRNRRHITDVLGEQQTAGNNNGTDGEHDGPWIPFHNR
jgi:hypothetical protein